MASELFLVSWNSFHKNMNLGMNSLLENEDFVDVTLAVEGRYLKAHKMVLSVCSSYFSELFKTSPCKHPIVFMKDVSYSAMSDLLQFMYKGEVQVNEEDFNTFIKTAESLQIKGLSNYGNGSAECGNESANKNTKLMESEVARSKNSMAQETPIPAAKRLRLEDHSQDEIVKAEQTTVEESAPASSSNVELISLKAEPYEEEESSFGIGDDDSNENFFDDPLDETNPIRNDSDWMMEGEEVHQVDTKSEASIEEEAIVDELEDYDDSVSSCQIPEKSKKVYEHSFEIFEKWCIKNAVNEIDEKVLIRYFEEKSVNYKPSSLMTHYSMLRITLRIKKNIDISQYRKLLFLLKKTSEGYTAKKSLILKKVHFEKFLKEANDEIYLMKKVVVIIGVAGACKREELTYLLMENVIDEGNFIRIQLPLNRRNQISREFIVTAGNIENVNLVEIIRKYINLRPPGTDHQRFFLCYQQGKCTKQPVGKNSIGSIPKNIAQFLGLPNPEQYTGHCFRKSSMLFKVVPTMMNFH